MIRDSGGTMRIVVLGGGFGGVATVRHLERVLRRRTDVESTREPREPLRALSIEDATGDPSAPLYDLALAVERVRAARQAIDESGAESC
jgi:NADH dehydrogenase FAD-containing subunit